MRKSKITRRAFLCAVFLVSITLMSCRTVRTEYVPVEQHVYHTDTLRLSTERIDTIIERDSIALFIKGDTVLKTVFKERIKYRDRTDTVYKARVDTARIEIPIPVEKELSKWQKVKQDIGGMAIGIISFAVLAALVWLLLRLRKQAQ